MCSSCHSSWKNCQIHWHVAKFSSKRNNKHLDVWVLHEHLRTFLHPRHSDQTICMLHLERNQSFQQPASFIYIMSLTNPNWHSQYPSFTWRIIMVTAYNFALYKPWLPLFFLEQNLSCYVHLCPWFQSLLCSNGYFLFLLQTKLFCIDSVSIRKCEYESCWAY